MPYIVHRAIPLKLARQTKTIQIRYVWARSLFLKTEKISCTCLKKYIFGYMWTRLNLALVVVVVFK